MTDLSPAAQAVLDAALKYSTQAWSEATHQRFNLGIAAALRAAADQVVPFNDEMSTWARLLRDVRSEFLSIANELDQPYSAGFPIKAIHRES